MPTDSESCYFSCAYGVFSPCAAAGAQVAVEAQILRRQHLRREDDLAGVHREVLDDVIDRLQHRHVVLLHDDALGEPLRCDAFEHRGRLFDRRAQPSSSSAARHAAARRELRVALAHGRARRRRPRRSTAARCRKGAAPDCRRRSPARCRAPRSGRHSASRDRSRCVGRVAAVFSSSNRGTAGRARRPCRQLLFRDADDFFFAPPFLAALFFFAAALFRSAFLLRRAPFFGIFAPDCRASLNAIAIACFGLVTFFLPPDFSSPSLYSCITFFTLPRPFVDAALFRCRRRFLFAPCDSPFPQYTCALRQLLAAFGMNRTLFWNHAHDEGTHSHHRRRSGGHGSGVADRAPRAARRAARDASRAAHAGAPDRPAGGAGLQQLAEDRAGRFGAVAAQGGTAPPRFAAARARRRRRAFPAAMRSRSIATSSPPR